MPKTLMSLREIGHPKETMPKIHIVATYCLRNDAPVLIPVLKLAHLWHRAVLPVPVGAVTTPWNPYESPFGILIHLLLDRLWCPHTQVIGVVLRNDLIAELVKRKFGNILPDPVVLLDIVE